MKKATILLFLIAFVLYSRGQSTLNGKIPLFARFNIGDSISKFEKDIRHIADKGTDVRSYQYLPSLKEPIVIGKCSFHILLLYFDDRGKLTSLHFTRLSKEKNFLKKAMKSYKSLVAFFNDSLQLKGSHKVYYPTVHEGHEWILGNEVLTVEMQNTGKRESTNVGISLQRQ